VNAERIGSWFSFFANLGVLLGLALLLAELRHNTLATQASLYQESMSFAREHAELLIGDENSELASIVFRGETDPSSLSPIELERFVLFTAWRMNTWETTFLNYDKGLVEERIWNSVDRWYSSLLLRGSGYQKWWEMAQHGYDPLFREHVDQAFEQAALTTSRSRLTRP
jgi:hypothetical protein